MRLSTAGVLTLSTVALVFLRGEGCGESSLPPKADGGTAPGAILDCENGDLDLTVTPGQNVELPDCGLGDGFEVSGVDLPRWALLDRDTETGRRQLRFGLDAPVGGPVTFTVLFTKGSFTTRMAVHVTVAELSAFLSLDKTTPGVREQRAWSASLPAQYVVPAGAPAGLIVEVASLHGVDVIEWLVAPAADPTNVTPYSGNLRRYFELEEGAWDITAEIRDQRRNTVTVAARVYAMRPDTWGLVVVSQVPSCAPQVTELEAMLGGPCDRVDTSAAPVCMRVEVVDGMEPLTLAENVATTTEPGRPRAPNPSESRSQVFAFCAGSGETVTFKVGALVVRPGGDSRFIESNVATVMR